jgi:hypothetical protein
VRQRKGQAVEEEEPSRTGFMTEGTVQNISVTVTINIWFRTLLLTPFRLLSTSLQYAIILSFREKAYIY